MASRRRVSSSLLAVRAWLSVAGVLLGCQVLSGVNDLTIVPSSSAAGDSTGGGSNVACTKNDGASAGKDVNGTAGAGADAGATSGCTPGSCADGQLCRDGTCIEPMADDDDDGIAAGSDCDDHDAQVGITADRDCESACAAGTEHCVMGAWAACDAPM
jgi:hypothetical protein